MAVTENGGDSGAQLRGAGFTESPEGRNWYRSGRILALQAEADKVEYALREDVLPSTNVQKEAVGPGLVRFSWDSGADPGQIVDDVRVACQREWGERYTPKVSPDHLFGVNLDPITGQPFDAGGPAGLPRLPGNGDPNELAPRTVRQRSGEGVVVGVVDTGIARGSAIGLEPQDWLDGAFLATPGDFDELNHEGSFGDQAGHGTFVAGVVLQHAPGATIRIARALQPNGLGESSEVADAIYRLARSGIDILSLSLGSFTRKNNPPMAVEAALNSLNCDVVVVAAAGNLGVVTEPGEPPVTTPREFWPAALPSVFSVGALDTNGLMANFSNSGPWVRAYTQGVDVFSTYLTREDARDPQAVKQFRGYAYWSGTSFATPAVSGAIAARMQKDKVSAREAADRIMGDATSAVAGGKGGKSLILKPKVRARRGRSRAS